MTREGITRDLEEMRRQGLGGANIIDAGGDTQGGHRGVPHGPDFASAEWCELFSHAVAEADRLGLELGFNIQSGWNLGGPTVTAEHAAKKLIWSETTVSSAISQPIRLPKPIAVRGYYRDISLHALPLGEEAMTPPPFVVTVASQQRRYPVEHLTDGLRGTCWVSGGTRAGEGPSPDRPIEIGLKFAKQTPISRIILHPRAGYGPRRGAVQARTGMGAWRRIAQWEAVNRKAPITIDLEPMPASNYRLLIVDAFDTRGTEAPRNVQIAEVELFDGPTVLGSKKTELPKVSNYRQKAYHGYPGPPTGTESDHLLRVEKTRDGDRFVERGETIDLTGKLTADGTLNWIPPAGKWKLIRLGYTLSGSHVSTSSEGGGGLAIDYLDHRAFEQYWREVIDPILDKVAPHVGKSLKFLHTDSWELGPLNWTPRLAEEFERLRGYDPRPYFPVLAGFVIDDRKTSTRFLNDFRRTLADLIATGKYATFRDHAHREGLGIHPESGGPHPAPIDALQCLGRSDIPMGEFWARSETHRVHDYQRLFIKQASSAAHTYGRRCVLAEAFTTIGPQWEKDPAMLKPVFDRVACEGLNLVMLHTFAATTEEMGLPGQAYFAGTHINPNTTWWNQADAFFGYLNRSQFLLQQGIPVSDVLHFYGENVPSFVRLKRDNPAGVPEGYDYDVINAEALIERVEVQDRLLVLPDGTSYQLLSLPPNGTYGLASLRKISQLAKAGAAIVGPRPNAPIGLVSKAEAAEFTRLAERLWGANTAIKSISVADALTAARVVADMDYKTDEPSADQSPVIDFVHRRTDTTEIYFVVNCTSQPVEVDCRFRVSGGRPEIWDPVTGDTAPATTYQRHDEVTQLPLKLSAEQAVFVLIRPDESIDASRQDGPNLPVAKPLRTLSPVWNLSFDPTLGGPAEPIAIKELIDWTSSQLPGVKYYSGEATYRARLDLEPSELAVAKERRTWLDLGVVKNVAEVKLNGHPCGVAWTPPYRVELTGHLQANNSIEITVANLWPNRLIGDAALPIAERTTKTNIAKFKAEMPLLPSGLLGPVRLMQQPSG